MAKKKDVFQEFFNGTKDFGSAMQKMAKEAAKEYGPKIEAVSKKVEKAVKKGVNDMGKSLDITKQEAIIYQCAYKIGDIFIKENLTSTNAKIKAEMEKVEKAKAIIEKRKAELNKNTEKKANGCKKATK